jgi:transcriptional regulator with XRE-family HTH domain
MPPGAMPDGIPDGLEGLGARMRLTRERLGLYQAAIAKACKVTVGAVSQWEDGSVVPTLAHAKAAAKRLRVSPAWLTFGSK